MKIVTIVLSSKIKVLINHSSGHARSAVERGLQSQKLEGGGGGVENARDRRTAELAHVPRR